MKRPTLQSILFNGAGVAIAVTVVGYMVQSLFTTERIAACAERYAPGHQFALQKSDGKTLSPIEMQANLSAREWGLLNNARVVEARDSSARYLQVALEPTGSEDDENQNGVGFIWQPSNFAGASSACLSYRLFLPADFAFNGEGYLPGLFAGIDFSLLDSKDAKSGFAARIGWQKNGDAGIALRSAASPAGRWIVGKGTAWPTGRWVEIQQEVRMNDPGKANGMILLWIDGQLKLEGYKLNLGTDEPSSLTGVVADIHYLREAEKGSRLTISPFVLQWQQLNKVAGTTVNPG